MFWVYGLLLVGGCCTTSPFESHGDEYTQLFPVDRSAQESYQAGRLLLAVTKKVYRSGIGLQEAHQHSPVRDLRHPAGYLCKTIFDLITTWE